MPVKGIKKTLRMKNQLSANLIALMDYHRIGGVQLARATNIPLSTIKNIRKGANINPTIETLIPLARYFRISLDDIVNSNLSVEKIGVKINRLSQCLPQALPVLSWENAIDWPEHNPNDFCVFTERKCDKRTFALHLEQNISDLFVAPGVFLIDPMRKPLHFDYVLVHKFGLNRAFLKQIIFDEESSYLKSLVIASKLEALDENYRLLGVIIEYRQFIKLLDVDQDIAAANNYSSNEEAMLVSQI